MSYLGKASNDYACPIGLGDIKNLLFFKKMLTFLAYVHFLLYLCGVFV